MNDEELIVSNLKRVEAILEQVFGNRLSELAKIDARRITISKIISDDKEFLAKDPNIVLIRFIRDNWENTNHNFLLFLRSLRAKKNQIQLFEGELAANLLRELKRTETEFGNEDNFNKLIALYINITTYPEKDYIIGYLKTSPHSKELQNAINSIRNVAIGNHIRETIAALTNEELDYLIKYHNEISFWNNKEAITEDIQFFTAKISSFLYGRGEQYLGLFTYFKDEKLEQMIKSNPAYLQLTRYNLQLLYLRRLKEKIQTYQTGDWTQFEEVYNNVKRIADKFVREFGNPKIASELFVEKKEIREYPERWLQDIDAKIAEISSVQYRKTNVIGPFIREIERIFNLRINELRSMAKPEVDELKDAIKSLINLEKNSAENIIKEATKFREKMRKKLGKLRKDFDAISNRCVDALHDFVEAKIRIIHKGVMPEILLRLKNAKALVKNEGQFVQHSMQVIGPDLERALIDPVRGIALLYDLDKAFRATAGASYNLRSMGNIFTRKDTLRKLDDLNKNLEVAEKAYSDLDRFILTELGFLVQNITNEEVRREDYGRTTAT